MWVIVNEHTIDWLSSYFVVAKLVIGEIMYIDTEHQYAHLTEYRGRLVRDHTDSEVQQYILDWTLKN